MTLETMTKDERQEIQAFVNACDLLADTVRETIAPQVHAIEKIEGTRDEYLMSKGNLEVAGECINCQCILFSGDKGYRYEEGELSCIECSPTWTEAEESFKAAATDDDEHAAAYADFKSRMDAHVAAGGSPDEKNPIHDLRERACPTLRLEQSTVATR